MSDIETVAEAIWHIQNGDPWSNADSRERGYYLRAAQAAIDALQLKEEKRNIRSICDMADTAGIDKRRWVTPWTSVTT